MKRRSFLGAMLAAASAPAIVRSESLMKIFVPPEKKIIMPKGYYDGCHSLDGQLDIETFSHIEFTDYCGAMLIQPVFSEVEFNPAEHWNGMSKQRQHDAMAAIDALLKLS